MSPKYLSDIIPSSNWIRTLRNANNILLIRVNNNYFTNTFFHSEYNKFDLSVRNSTSRNIFKGRLLQSVTPLENSVYTYCVYVVCVYQNRIRIKCVTRQRLGFIHLCYHKLKHGFLDVIDPLCNCTQQSKIMFITSSAAPTFQLHKILFSMKLQLLANWLLI